jgi:hypothetical protein
LVALVKDNAKYKEYKDLMLSIGSLSMGTFTDLEQWLQSVAKGGFEIKNAT